MLQTRSDRLSKPVSRYGSSASLKKVAEVTGDSDESESDVTEGDNDSSFHETPAGKQVKKLAHELKKKRKLAAAAPGPNVTFDVPPEDDEEEEEEPKKREFLAPLNPPPTSNTVVAQKPVGMSPSADLSVAGLMAMTTTPKHHGKFFAPLKGVQGKH